MSAPMTPDREQEIRAREQAATPGPWMRDDDQQRLERFVTDESGTLDINFGYLGNNNQADTEFVADARSAVPELLAEVDRLRAEVSNLSDDVTGACLARYEEEQDADRLRLALASAQRGRRQLRSKLEGLKQGYARLEARCTYIAKAAVSWRKEAEGRKAYGLTLRARVAELEAQLAEHERPSTAEAYPGELVMHRGLLGVLRVVAQHGDMTEVRRLLAEHANDEQAAYAEAPAAPRDLRPGAEAARLMIRDRPSMTADEWNARYPVTRDDEALTTVTRSRAWTLGHGAAVVSVEGYSGGIRLTHVDPAPGAAS
ncbi:hypothetical protein OG909_24920 [Streptomyces sp. NBC_01754]|uniref:hypothetical protein n=1 Tax=Streptomyces sp. NBC_01754 TaxID=2975930 RepID=UPI002DDB895D|nr:hypothetical protein [Streptomyces sp. NBC_01754]WSC95258.1 hypothetical protein OG909_24920 [Streptomyces sp. NBC_01754]